MNDVSPVLEPKISNRLQSLDFVRGLTMVLLTLESTELYNHLRHATKGTLAIPITESFFHHPWHGLRLWDVVQPVFMFVEPVMHQQQIKMIVKRFLQHNIYLLILMFL